MKLNLRIGEKYALSKHKPKYAYIQYFSLLAVATIMCLEAHAQSPESSGPVPSGNNSFTEIITADAKSQYGMLGVHEVGGKIYLEIPDSLPGRDILAVNRLAKGWTGSNPYIFNLMARAGYAGDPINEQILRFVRFGDCQIGIELANKESYTFCPGDSDMADALENSDTELLLLFFDIVCRNPKNDGSLIDATELFEGDNELTAFSGAMKKQYKVGAFQPKQSTVSSVQTTDNTLRMQALKTFQIAGKGQMPLRLEGNWLLLPATPMRHRLADNRVGYNTVTLTDYVTDPLRIGKKELATRWRLEPRPADRDEYLAGRLVKPLKPIVFYIDPATPKQWVPYMIQGVNDWQAAFEQAGFRQAIEARLAPDSRKDSLFSPLALGHGFISYKPDKMGNATTVRHVDTRSGEIVGAHIAFYHGMLQTLEKWAWVQGGASGSKLPIVNDRNKRVGRMVRYIISHEVGHALGLTHNFRASSTVPVEKLRDRIWLADSAYCPSIMDYARLNYVAQPEDSVGEAGLFPRIGVYDRWAIEWGYRFLPDFPTPQDEEHYLQRWVDGKQSDGRLVFGSETNVNDPDCQAEDLGDDAIKAGDYGIRNLKRISAGLRKSVTDSLSEERWAQIREQFGYYVNRVAVYAGSTGDEAALQWLDKQLFNAPLWLFRSEAGNNADNLDGIGKMQGNALARLLKIIPSGSHAQLQKLIWRELYEDRYPDAYRRQLQRIYLTEAGKLLTSKSDEGRAVLSETGGTVRYTLAGLASELAAAIPGLNDKTTSAHYKQALAYIQTLNF